eukprot:jgi/Tetstr1/443639/TSEL_031637.t1
MLAAGGPLYQALTADVNGRELPGNAAQDAGDVLQTFVEKLSKFQANGTETVLKEAWFQHRVQIRNDTGDQSCVLTYWDAPSVDLRDAYDLEWVKQVKWAELFPVSNKAARPHGWYSDSDDQSEDSKSASECEDEDEDDSWHLSPKLAWILCRELWNKAVELMEEDEVTLEAVTPSVATPYVSIPGWTEQMAQGAARMAARLEKGICSPLPNCTAEEVLLRSALEDLAETMFDIDIYYPEDEQPSEIPSSKFDYDLDPIRELVIEDEDVSVLFQPNCDIGHVNDPVLLMMAAANLHPAEWFKPFKFHRFTDHVSFAPGHRIDMQKRAASVLGRGTLFPQQVMDVIASHMEDAELLRVLCCARADVTADLSSE